MLRLVFLVLLTVSLAAAQEKTPTQASPAAPEAAKSADIATAHPKQASSPAVITIKGICNSPAANSKAPAAKDTAAKTPSPGCKTVVTRAEFEELVDTLKVPPAARKQFASQYATALIMGAEAHKHGLDHGAHYDQLLKLAKLQVLTRQLAQSLQDESAKISDQEIQNYYQNNSGAYVEATLDRLYIPRTQQQDPPKDASKESEADAKKQQADSEAAMKKEADDLRARAAAGEDFAKLQAEAYKFANFKATAPESKMEKVRRTTLPASQSAVFDLKPGEVSQLLNDPSGYFVYKLEEKDTVPLDRVHDEIKASLQKQRMQDATQTMQQSATPTFDEQYFAATSPAPPPRTPGAIQGLHAPASTPSGPK